MKKMKGVLAMEPSSYAGYEDPRTRFKHQSLMQDYEELQKDAEAMKKKLQMMKQKKSTLLAEVRFLSRRYKYLMGNQSMNSRQKQAVVRTHNFETQRTKIMKGRSYSKKESALRINHALDLNQKERINHGMEDTLRKSAPKFDLNQKREEEEEFQANCEPLRIEEPNKSLLRGGNDEQHTDMKLLVCRTIGNGSNRSGKRKITWQDQVALRV
ncbi:uncharacterized protein LOC18769660 isoform X2 [Prunus persica]|uniref:uncharacterized protein LOC18769660 isoform X2 n=1 Tax=Prunus persica TaxID=3760 RepID=UPI0009AB46F7|nr:uncharacterized protein LOC18769660 isoform X2 [Prunus persica]